jgi:hypothetical protein
MKRFILSICFLILFSSIANAQWLMVVGSKGGTDSTPPTMTSATIPAAGNVINLVYDEVVSVGAGGNTGWVLTMTAPTTMAYASGNGSNTLVYTLSRPVNTGESITIAYTQPGDGIEDATGNDLASLSGVGVTNSSGLTYLAEENFDGSSACAATYSSNCDKAWIVAAGTPDFDFATPLEGTYSLSLAGKTNAASASVYLPFTPVTDPQETHFLMNIDAGITGGAAVQYIVALQYTTSARANVKLQWTGTVYKLQIVGSSGSTGTTGTALSIDTVYHVWINYTKGQGTPANGHGSVAFAKASVDGVRITSAVGEDANHGYAEFNDSNSTTAANRLYLYGNYTSAASSVDMIFDKVRIDDATIGDNPS